MSRFLVLNFQDNGLNKDIMETIQSHTLFCICCLERNVDFINITTCSHSDYLYNFTRPELKPINEVICHTCHRMLKKIKQFKLQVMQSFNLLTTQALNIETANKVKPSFGFVKVVDINIPSENPNPREADSNATVPPDKATKPRKRTNHQQRPKQVNKKQMKNIKEALNIIDDNTSVKLFPDVEMLLEKEEAGITEYMENLIENKEADIMESEETLVENKEASIMESKETLVKNEQTDIMESLETLVVNEEAAITEFEETLVKNEEAAIMESEETLVKIEEAIFTESVETFVENKEAAISESEETFVVNEEAHIMESVETFVENEEATIIESEETLVKIEEAIITESEETLVTKEEASVMEPVACFAKTETPELPVIVKSEGNTSMEEQETKVPEVVIENAVTGVISRIAGADAVVCSNPARAKGDMPKLTAGSMEPQKRRKVYSKTQLAKAVQAINEGTSIYEASKRFHIPETTLRDKRDGKYKNEICGVQPVLNSSEEKQIVDWIHHLGKMEFSVTKEQLLETVAKLVQNLNRPNPFKNGVPGRYWLRNFLKRHPTVPKLFAQNFPLRSNQVTEAAIRAWFDRVNNYFKTNNLHHVLEDPRRVFNCDETAFFLCPKEEEILVSRGSKRVYNRVANDENECLTVLVNVSADGKLAPPMILFPYKRLPQNLVPTLPRGWGLGNTESGWLNTEAFYEYVTNCFYPWLITNQIPFPVVLFLDGHTSHISLSLSIFCEEKAIILIALLPNSTHVLQPLDVAVFRPVKEIWRTVVHEFRIQNNYTNLKHTDFAPAVKKCFDQCLKPEIIQSGFRFCGLYPFDPSKINYSKLLTNSKLTEDINRIITTSEYAEKFYHDFEARSPLTLQTFKDSGGEWMDPNYNKTTRILEENYPRKRHKSREWMYFEVKGINNK